jgi:hypothetical protein
MGARLGLRGRDQPASQAASATVGADPQGNDVPALAPRPAGQPGHELAVRVPSHSVVDAGNRDRLVSQGAIVRA